jgi:hypothetical protein
MTTTSQDGKITLYLADHWIAKIFQELSLLGLATRPVESLSYMAPEVADSKDGGSYNAFAADGNIML